VWQDFGFACGVYPSTPEFLEEVRLEAEDIVKRLRSHTCLALWCGNNENESLSRDQGPEARFHKIYYELLPDVCQALDADRAYWPGSPASESREVDPDSDQEGDRHNWDVWFMWKTTDRITDDARYNSEFGAQSFPQRESIESFMHPDDAWTLGSVSKVEGASPGLLFARHGAQFDKLFGQAAAYGPIWDLDAAIATTQTLQAETIGRYVRHYRRNVRYSGGVIVWNYTSTWPSICWALIDWYRRPKHAFYECRRCFRALAVGIEPLDEGERSYGAWVTRDRAGSAEGELKLELHDMVTGGVVLGTKSRARVEGFQASEPVRLELSAELDRTRHALVATFEPSGSGAGEVARDIRYLTPLSRVRGFGGRVSARYDGRKVELRSSGWRSRIAVESWEAPVIWSDNYIDLLPGETRTLELARGQAPEQLWLVADQRGRRERLKAGTSTEIEWSTKP
ncbi:MAG TPA: glycoside hydrolase family 2 protein, partial [Polyangiaceae bacterium]|nr:glycoside hydrolase family 2 protein [Polyangiaceae bacterium]